MHGQTLVFRADRHLVAIGLDHVTEVLRPLRVEPLGGLPPFVRGLCMLRGVPAPVIEVGILLRRDDGVSAATPSDPNARRFVGMRTGRQPAVLAVDEVIGVRDIPLDLFYDLSSVSGPAAYEAVRGIDDDPLLFLAAAHVVPESVWAVMESATGQPVYA